MGKSVAKYRLCRCRRRCRCRWKINNLMKKETGTSLFFISHSPPTLLAPFVPLGLSHLTRIQVSHPLGPFLLPCYAQTSASPELQASFSASDIALDAHLVESAAELPYHCRILALGLTKRVYLPGRFTRRPVC